MIVDITIGSIGALLVLTVYADVFMSVIVPRPMRAQRVSAWLSVGLWAAWRGLWERLSGESRRERALGIYAPFMMVTLLAVWLVTAIVGFGLMAFALRREMHPPLHDIGQAVYFAGATLLTIGYGDFTPAGAWTRVLAIVAAATGLSLFAVTITFLFSVFASFQRRELYVVTLEPLAGAPPSGVHLLETHGELQLLDDLPQTLRDGRNWVAEILESHLAYPVLAYFRSSHQHESWVATLGALLDAATLTFTSLEDVHTGEARLFILLGKHLSRDLAEYFADVVETDDAIGPGIDRSEFDYALARLRHAGFSVREADEAWPQFARIRASYAGDLDALARYWAIPPALWVGDRGLINPHKRRRRTSVR